MNRPVGEHRIGQDAGVRGAGAREEEPVWTGGTGAWAVPLGLWQKISSSRAFNAVTGPLVAALFFWMLLNEFHNLSQVLHLPEDHQYGAQFYAWFLATISKIIFISLIVALLLIRRQPVSKARGLQPRFTALVGTFMVALIAMIPAAKPTLAQSIAGLVLIATGSALSAVAIGCLGRSFSIMAEARELVTHGLYSVVRHPLYVAEEIAVVGAVVIHFSLPVLLLLLLHIGFQIQRARNEEAVLSETFPDYEGYRQRTPRFIPGVY
ncbi:MAG: methyltransferase family protein [Planctomycetota bacterium]|jgi:protein-S-isoprenylcysteine O-methyltransferase Ste14